MPPLCRHAYIRLPLLEGAKPSCTTAPKLDPCPRLPLVPPISNVVEAHDSLSYFIFHLGLLSCVAAVLSCTSARRPAGRSGSDASLPSESALLRSSVIARFPLYRILYLTLVDAQACCPPVPPTTTLSNFGFIIPHAFYSRMCVSRSRNRPPYCNSTLHLPLPANMECSLFFPPTWILEWKDFISRVGLE